MVVRERFDRAGQVTLRIAFNYNECQKTYDHETSKQQHDEEWSMLNNNLLSMSFSMSDVDGEVREKGLKLYAWGNPLLHLSLVMCFVSLNIEQAAMGRENWIEEVAMGREYTMTVNGVT